VPGGVGPLCVSNVGNNLLKAYCEQNGLLYNYRARHLIDVMLEINKKILQKFRVLYILENN
jgi:hypothetical protein